MQPTALALYLQRITLNHIAKNDDKYKGKQLISYSTPYNTYFYRQNHTLYLLIHSQQQENIISPITISSQKLL